MVKRAFVESRPYLLLSLIFAISYYVVRDNSIGELFLMPWKGAGTFFLALYAVTRAPCTDGRLLAAVMVFSAIGDMLIMLDMFWGAIPFAIAHVVAIVLYWRNRRASLAPTQLAFAIILVPVVIFLASVLPQDSDIMVGIGIYAAFLAIMAAMAWTSSFPRYRVGAGALLFVASDLLIFAQDGLLSGTDIPEYAIWPLYYFGQFLICTGVVQTLRKRLA